MKNYQGSCHCGRVKYEATIDLQSVIECNCSYCEIKGLLFTFIPYKDFILTQGKEDLTLYQFNKHVINHYFCRFCGVESFAEGDGPDGKTAAINARTLNGVNISTIKRVPYDGRNK